MASESTPTKAPDCPDPAIVRGPIDMSRRKDDLIAIAIALHGIQIDSKDTKPVLIAKIKKFLEVPENQKTVNEDPHLQLLTTYRATVPQSMSGSKESGKTSADKAAEDADADAKTPAAPTG